MMMFLRQALLAASCTFALLGGTAAAQVAPTPPPGEQPPTPSAASTDAEAPAATPDPTLADIVVTARRRAESLQKVPISITAFSGEGLKERGVQDLKGLSNFTPNLELNSGRPDGGGTTAQIYIRGVGQNDFLIPNDPGVGLYVDDVYVSRSSGAVSGLSDVASIEVLRGPQGTLYGKNTIGGAVRITTTRPDLNDFSGRMAVTLGSYGRHDFTGSVNVPLGDDLAVRIAGASRNTNDIGKRPLDPSGRGTGNINQQAGRIVALYRPSSDLSLTVIGDYTRTDQHQAYGANRGYFAGASALIDVLNASVYPRLATSLGLPVGTTFDGRWVSTPKRNFGTGPNIDKFDVWGLSATTAYDLTADIQLKSITAYRSVKGVAGRDGDASPFPVLETISRDDNEQFSQEIQLNGSSLADRFKWTLGLYYLRENLENRLSGSLWGGLAQSPVGQSFDPTSLGRLKGNSYAVFGQGTYDLSDRLHLTLGGRYNIEKKDFQNRWTFAQPNRSFTCPGVFVDGVFRECKSTDKVFTPAASIGYDVTPTVLTYASYSEGFKAGGWTPRLFSQQSLKQFRPEKLKAYEAGVKSSFLDRRVILNADMFYSDYSDLQLTSVLADSQGNPQPVVENAGSARIWGIEAETTIRLGGGTRIQGGLGFIDARYTRLDPGVSFGLDNKLPDVPPLTVTGSINQDVAMANGGNVTLQLDGSYKGKTYKDPGNSPFVIQRPFVLLNARASYSPAGAQWTLAVFGTNLLDKQYLVNGLDLRGTFGIIESYFGRPREFGAEFSVKF